MEIANVGVRTRAMAATEIVKKKRGRFHDDEEAQVKVTSSTTSYIQLRSRRILVDHRRKENRRSSHNSDHDDDVSCCSSNIGSSEKRIIELPDLEDESIEVETSPYFSSRESSMNSSRRETTPSSELRAEPEDQDSMSKPSEVNSHRRSTVENINPIQAEIEEFFASAEKDLQKHFTEKYNFDFVKEEPLEGRYEWVRLKPLGKSQNEKIEEKSNE
ncbi:cyclin-dependent kinase inhibitor 1-like [Herrania umbratica]|uniref:Cyclin-dependent kinase inhibitor n=1 Tax=Herrania umbratica TaxID=108875 RepID=A0A6J0ZHN9_9ROSI|nr:cyclin-dependent kinase inhibitor 1-like [Herrania umbratica]